MITLLTVLHVFVCLFLIIGILLQSSKGGGLAGVFGGGGMGGVFGGRGAASFLAKVTMYLGIAFAIMAFSIALLTKRTTGSKSMVQQVMEKEGEASPASMLPTVPGEQDNLIGQEVPAGNAEESK